MNNTQEHFYHEAIMPQECVDALVVNKNGVYVDCTFGGGGHAKKILEALNPEGKLFAFDQDESAKRNLIEDKRFQFFGHNFCYVRNFLQWKGIEQVDGIFADLGVSSHQIDTPERGFSIRFDDQKLDMRMDKRQTKTAIDVLNTYTQEALANVFFYYGELLNSRQLAACIIEERKKIKIETLGTFKKVIQKQIKGMEQKYVTKALQALRIEVNDELGALKELLFQTPYLLKPQGRLVILSFHSLEDRLVKRWMRNEDVESAENQSVKMFQLLFKKPIEASVEEMKRNSRSKSAKLRVAERL